MRLHIALVLLAACGSGGGSTTGSTAGAGGSMSDASSAASGGTEGTGGAGGGAGTGGAGSCPRVPCPGVSEEGYICDASCGGSGCGAEVCQALAVSLPSPTNLRVHVPPITSQHPRCAENCETGARWAMRFGLPTGEHCVSVVGPDAMRWSVGGSEADDPACVLTESCGTVLGYGDDGATRYLTLGVPEGVDLPSGGVFTVRIEDAEGGCGATTMAADAQAACAVTGCNGDGG